MRALRLICCMISRSIRAAVGSGSLLAARRRLGAAEDPAFPVDDDDVARARIQLAQRRQSRIAVLRIHRPHQGPLRDRSEMEELTGQPKYPVVEFEDGSVYREDSDAMAQQIRDGKLFEHAGRAGA